MSISVKALSAQHFLDYCTADLALDPTVKSGLRWKEHIKRPRAKGGAEAGSYVSLIKSYVVSVRSCPIQAKHIVWMLANQSVIPDGKDVRFLDGNTCNLQPGNLALRDATPRNQLTAAARAAGAARRKADARVVRSFGVDQTAFDDSIPVFLVFARRGRDTRTRYFLHACDSYSAAIEAMAVSMVAWGALPEAPRTGALAPYERDQVRRRATLMFAPATDLQRKESTRDLRASLSEHMAIRAAQGRPAPESVPTPSPVPVAAPQPLPAPEPVASGVVLSFADRLMAGEFDK